MSEYEFSREMYRTCGCEMCTADPAEETTIDPKDAE